MLERRSGNRGKRHCFDGRSHCEYHFEAGLYFRPGLGTALVTILGQILSFILALWYLRYFHAIELTKACFG